MAITFVQKTWAATNGTSVTTPAIDTTQGNLIISRCVNYGWTPNITTDNNSESWTSACDLKAGSSSEREDYCIAKSDKSGHTFTCSLASTGYPCIAVSEWSGVNPVVPLVTSVTGSESGDNVVVCPSIDTIAGSLIHSGCSVSAGTALPILNAGNYTAEQLRADGGTLEGMCLAYCWADTAGTYAGAEFTLPSTSAEVKATTAYAAQIVYDEMMSGGITTTGETTTTQFYLCSMNGGVEVDGDIKNVSQEHVWLDQQVVDIEMVKIHVIPLSMFIPDHTFQGR